MTPLATRLWAKVRKTEGCWVWTGALTRPGGYGRIGLGGRRPQRVASVHALSWQFANGPVPPGLRVLHKCDNPPCVRPSHLFLGTQAENMQDAVAKGRLGKVRGERHHMAKLTAADVLAIRALRLAGAATSTLSVRYGVSRDAIQRVINGRNWSHV